MNILDLDRIGERLLDLDQNDELYNCTAQLVIATSALTAALSAVSSCEKGSEAERQAIKTVQTCREQALAALKPFESSLQ